MAHGDALPHSPTLLTRENIWTAMIVASLATPLNVAFLPAAIPATWVPCRHSARGQGAAVPGPVAMVGSAPGHTPSKPLAALVLEKQASATTFDCKNGWVRSTPVSMMATVCPDPV